MQLKQMAGCGFTETLGLARLSVRRARQQTMLRRELCLNGKLAARQKGGAKKSVLIHLLTVKEFVLATLRHNQ
jgi:hypothetical protein